MTRSHFPILILNARPAAGKSEIIDYLQRMPVEERLERFHIGVIDVIDDFPMLWTWFEEDAILSRMGHPRLHTHADGYFKETYLWHLLIERISQEYEKQLRDQPAYHATHTTLIEFSRGTEHGGYADAYPHFSKTVLDTAAALYVRVSFAESLRKNRARSNPERPDSILEHSLSDEKMHRLYRGDDWDEWTADDPVHLHVGEQRIPYAVFENEDDVTTEPGPALSRRLSSTLATLWERYLQR